VSADPGVWVETVVPEPSVGSLFVSFAALVLAFVRFKPQYKSNTAVLTQSIESEKPL
jgi:hypothetical protein